MQFLYLFLRLFLTIGVSVWIAACGGGGGDGDEIVFMVTTLAGDGTQGYLDDTGIAAKFDEPRGITTDGINLYVVDADNNRIRQIVIATGVTTTFAGEGTQGYLDGALSTARFNRPLRITNDGISFYISDTFNHRIRRIQ